MAAEFEKLVPTALTSSLYIEEIAEWDNETGCTGPFGLFDGLKSKKFGPFTFN